MSADIRYGGRVAVSFGGVMDTLQMKLDADRANLSILLSDDEGLHNFEAQVMLMKDIQATVRTMDVLKGEIDINGERSAAGLTRDLKSHGKDEEGNLKQSERIIPPANASGEAGPESTDETLDDPLIDMTALGRSLTADQTKQ